MNIEGVLLFIFCTLILCIVYLFITKTKIINSFTSICFPIIISIFPVIFINDYKLNWFSYVYLFIHILTIFIVFFIIDIYILKKIKWKNIEGKELFALSLLLLQIFATIKQIISISQLFNESFFNILLYKTVYLEDNFLLSGYAYLFRFNIPLIIIFESMKKEKLKFLNTKTINIIIIYLLITTFLRFNKTEPIIALLCLSLQKYFNRQISIKKFIFFGSFILVFIFFINYYFFMPIEERNFENLSSTMIQKISLYTSSQYFAFDNIIKFTPEKFEGENNFQFITSYLSKLKGENVYSVHSSPIFAGPFSTNVFTYFGSFFTEFSWLGYPISIVFLGIVYTLVLISRSKLLYIYFLSNLMLCFFGNFFQFSIFWIHFLLLLVYSLNVKK